MNNPTCKKCGGVLKLQRNSSGGDLQGYCPLCKITVYPLPELSKAEDIQTDADKQQGEIEALIRKDGAPCPRRRDR